MTRVFTGRFAGYAAIFGRPDASGDVIRPGAFAASLAARIRTGDPLPLFWQHQPDRQIGWIERIAEDAKGLRVIARLSSSEGTNAAMLRAARLAANAPGRITSPLASGRPNIAAYPAKRPVKALVI